LAWKKRDQKPTFDFYADLWALPIQFAVPPPVDDEAIQKLKDRVRNESSTENVMELFQKLSEAETEAFVRRGGRSPAGTPAAQTSAFQRRIVERVG
jgi:hypothetical protein